MSLVKVELRPVVGSAVTINTVDGSGNHLYPLHNYDPEIDLPENEYKKMQATGIWPSFAYPGAMTVIMDGEVLGIGATDALLSTDMMTKRRALQNACLPPLDVTLTSRKHGVLRIRYDDMSEDADADYHCILCKIPLAARSPGKAPYFINFKCFTPYFVGVGTSTKYEP